MKEKGFTLLELLVIVAILGLISTAAFAAVNSAQQKARITKARADLSQYQKSIELLIADTQKWPNGCDVGHQLVNCAGRDHTPILEPCVALLQEPTLAGPGPASSCAQCHNPLIAHGSDVTRCLWTQPEIDSWEGPYISAVPETDPWGTNYYFDMDYEPYKVNGGGSCPGKPEEGEQAVIVSYGPDKDTENMEGCDDIFIPLETG